MRRTVLTLSLVAVLVGTSPVAAKAAGGATAPASGGGATYGASVEQGESAAERRAKRRAARKRRARARDRARTRSRARARARRQARRRERRDGGGAEPTAPTAPVSGDHVFPVQGAFSLGGDGSRFGARRRGHRHQGQDISAALGTPVVAPWAGTVERIAFQRDGAGLYIVLDGDGEDRDYVFMHLRRGSLRVSRGEPVAAGQQIAEVGNTGGSSGAHLHFEIWVGGGWYTGGRPIDPLPLLRGWLD